jgi:hypothetical protein
MPVRTNEGAGPATCVVGDVIVVVDEAGHTCWNCRIKRLFDGLEGRLQQVDVREPTFEAARAFVVDVRRRIDLGEFECLGGRLTSSPILLPAPANQQPEQLQQPQQQQQQQESVPETRILVRVIQQTPDPDIVTDTDDDDDIDDDEDDDDGEDGEAKNGPADLSSRMSSQR